MRIFLGLSDTEKECIRSWHSTETNTKYSKYQLGEPNGGTNENCVIIGRNNEYLADVSCSTKLNNHICEKPTVKYLHRPIPIGNDIMLGSFYELKMKN